MNKPIKKYLFYEVEGIWVNVLGESKTCAQVLDELNIIIDDKCNFARFYDYENNIMILYKALTPRKIEIYIWKIQTHIP